jgi:hypothetical protein
MWTRPHLIRFIGGLLAYVAVLFATIFVFERGLVAPALRVPVALLPMVPLILVAVAVMGAIRQSDELQARIQFEALAFAFALTAFTTFSYGFLQVYAGFPEVNMFIVWPVMASFWIVGGIIARRRYA